MPAPPLAQVTGYRDLLQAAFDGDPTTVLLSDDEQRLTRAEVAERVTAVRHQLVAANAGPETLVALRFGPGVDSIVAILGVQSAGAAYLPLDPRHGQARMDQIIAAASPDLVLDSQGLHPTRRADVVPAPSQGLDDLAYVISTSGSTGRPKAAELEQRGLVLHTQAIIDLFDLGASDTVLQTAPPSFDIAVWQCTTGIIAGARTHVATDEQRLDPRALWRVLIEERVTVTQLVPSMIRVMLDAAPVRSQLSLRHVISTGEALDPELANRWFATYPDLPLYNMYGPAECSDDVSVHILDGPIDPAEPVPIGRAFAGATLRIIDEHGTPVADGATGELQVCGDIVGRGYRNDPERTAASFGIVTVDGQPMRSYNTGDLVYRDDQGLLRFVGRRDFQVKVRGNRVELGEIESVLRQRDGITACVVTKFDDGTDRLVAHIETQLRLDRSALREALTAALPTYMVPSAFVLHPALPLNANGKVDRSQLPAPTSGDVASPRTTSSQAPSTPTEKALARNWARLLDLTDVPVDADFFDLGGTSLLAIISIDELGRELGYEISTSALITGGTIKAIAATVDAASPGQSDPTIQTTGLVQIQDHDGGTPLFLYPGEAVSALGMVELGRLVEPSRSVFVFEPARPIEGAPGPSMKVLAERCREAIDRVHPDGAVHLAGFCMGGDVAWEIARQREQHGQSTASVILLQTERDGHYPRWPDDVSALRVRIAKITQRARFEYATAKNLGRAQRRSHVRHLVLGKLVAKFTLPVEKRLHQSALAGKAGIRPSLRLKQHLWALVDRAAYDGWEPQPITTPVVVVRASEQPPLVTDDPLLGWASTGTGRITSREVPGFHWSFLHRPAVVNVAAALSAELSEQDEN